MIKWICLCKNAELNTRRVARKSLCFNENMKTGDIITENDLIALRPYDGICVSNFENYIGKTISVDVCKYSKVEDNSFVKSV